MKELSFPLGVVETIREHQQALALDNWTRGKTGRAH